MLPPGSTFAGYTIERVLGSDVDSEVYLARRLRPVTLKIFSARFSHDPRSRQKFERTVKSVMALDHPGIVGIENHGENDGRLWIASPVVDGTDLAGILHSRGPLPLPETGRIVRAAADTLDAAAANGLIHGSLGPGDIVLSPSGHVAINYFGNASITDTASPERRAGLPLSDRSDQYSLADIAGRLLAGNQLASDAYAVITKATATSPPDRFPTSAAFATALDTALTRPTPSAQPPMHQPSPTRKSGITWWLIGGAAALVVVIAVAATTVYFVTRSHDTPDPGAPNSEAKSMQHTPATPLSASLAEKPEKSLWTYTPPPGSASGGFAGGSAKYVLSWRLSPAPQQDEFLDIVDADSGKYLRSVNLESTGAYGGPDCAVDTAGTHAACSGTSSVVFIDLDKGVMTGQVPNAHDPVVADSGFLLTASIDTTTQSSRIFDVVSVDAAGRERWRASTASSPQLSSGTGVVTISTARDASDPFSKDRTEWRRVSDGKVLHTTDAAVNESLPWAPFIGGFMIPVGEHVEFFDLDGKRTGVGENGWTLPRAGISEPVESRSERVGASTPWLTSLPVLVRRADSTTLGNRTVDFGPANPATGHILWRASVLGNLPPYVTGLGTAVMVTGNYTSDSYAQEFGDTYAGYLSPRGSLVGGPELLASDGTNTLISGTSGEGTDLMALSPTSGVVWQMHFDNTAIAYGGKVYAGLHRII